jgi:hypothetical protein
MERPPSTNPADVGSNFSQPVSTAVARLNFEHRKTTKRQRSRSKAINNAEQQAATNEQEILNRCCAALEAPIVSCV